MSFSSEFAHSRQEDGKVVRQKGVPRGEAVAQRLKGSDGLNCVYSRSGITIQA